MIRIRSTRRSGIWRCGVHHGPEPVDYPDDRFSPQELALLQAEPMLVVERVDAPEPAAAEPPESEGSEDKPKPVNKGKGGKKKG